MQQAIACLLLIVTKRSDIDVKQISLVLGKGQTQCAEKILNKISESFDGTFTE